MYGGYQPNQDDAYQPHPNDPYESNEAAPINYNQQNYMTNTIRETSVESLNIDNYTGNNGMGGDAYAQAVSFPEESYILIWKYIEQIKSISAGSCSIY